MMTTTKLQHAPKSGHESTVVNNPWIEQGCRTHQVAGNDLPTMLQEQYGQLGEDLILEGVLKSHFARLGLPLNAVRYAEVGANHPIQTSNTYLFARKWGGRGVLVEANPALLPALRSVRTSDQILHFAVVPPGFPDQVVINIATHHELSSVDVNHVKSFGAIGTLSDAVEVPTVTLDELLETCFPQGVHLLSVDIEGLDLQVLEQSRLPVRPTFVVTEPSRHYHAQAEAEFGRVMREKRYVEVARTDYNLIYGDLLQLPAVGAIDQLAQPHPLRTFDIFDTLIARRCIHPHQIHVAVERTSGLEGFARDRVAAEAAVEHRDHGLEDIYAELMKRRGLDQATADRLMAMEVDEELNNVVPIADGMAELNRDSVLITDMYLSERVIRQLLARAGLKFDLPIVRSNSGKRHGKVWSDLASKGFTVQHLGDNAMSDVRTCVQSGMKARLSTRHESTPLEKALYVSGFKALSSALRAARLATPSHGLPAWMIQLQHSLNVPVLLTCAFYLRALGSRQPQTLLFASRDCRALQQIYEGLAAALGAEQMPSRYWYTSRLARAKASPDYQAYCRNLLEPGAMLVDLCGTGASLLKLFEQMGLKKSPEVFLCEWVDSDAYRKQMQKLLRTQGGQLTLQSLFSSSSFCDNNWLEWLNLSPEGMVVDVRHILGCAVPVRDERELEPEQARMVEQQSAYLNSFIENLTSADLVPAYLEVSNGLADLIQVLQEGLPSLAKEGELLNQFFRPGHECLDDHILARLSKL
jgi:FkbM family methyltransferase